MGEFGGRGVGSVGRSWRWFVAAGVTVVAFVVPTLVGGLWILPSVVKDTAAQWSVACALGAAVAALTVLWGQSFASDNQSKDPSVEARGERSIAVGGPVKGNLSTGDQGGQPAPTPLAQAPAAPSSTPASAPPPAGQGTAVASGNRSIALGGGLEGDADTGDRVNGTPTP
ncbi:hypothetical protein [Streptomyces sp. NPDC058745]|uniref:hypothetical protein n=1 Tax=Streptomyces sp. NPDC058745 TaxID=3346621 RepID=UPI0036C5094B